ncbi:MAG: ferrous iron transport protein A [Bacteroidetes bacterium]|nr:ferrous iron transport protein A [Bacteroidota bacterium]HET6245599.1 FeoA family protein [Bacteroidia bacterium]
MNNWRKLSDLKIGESAVIEEFSDDFLSLKFLEMGCLPGESITLERIAPMGDPIIVNVSGYLMTMRKSEAKTILVSYLGSA